MLYSPLRPKASADSFIPEIVQSITSSSSISIISQPAKITSLFTPEAKPLDLNFFFTDLTYKSMILLSGRISTVAFIKPVSSSMV